MNKLRKDYDERYPGEPPLQVWEVVFTIIVISALTFMGAVILIKWWVM